jgi:hypothetical protein
MTNAAIPSVTLRSARTGALTRANELGMRVMQERAYEKRGEQYLLIIAARVGQEPRADGHCARQAAQSGRQISDHCRARALHRR